MLISHKYKFIFIHNYKVAGQSIRKSLSPFASLSLKESYTNDRFFFLKSRHALIFSKNFNHHLNAQQIKKQIPRCYNSYFKFGFVRDPWDWQVSLYRYIKIDTANKHHHIVKQMKSFEEYIEWRVNEDINFQKEFFYAGEDCLVDYIGRFENLEIDFKIVTNKLGIECSLPHLNKSRADRNYLEYYNTKTINLVDEAFKEDILTFGYIKPTLNT